MLGVSLGILLAKYIFWADAERWEAVSWTAHSKGILLFALPDTFFAAARRNANAGVGVLCGAAGYESSESPTVHTTQPPGIGSRAGWVVASSTPSWQARVSSWQSRIYGPWAGCVYRSAVATKDQKLAKFKYTWNDLPN
jgi:hypothetical protein